MDELLGKLSGLIEELESKSVLLIVKGDAGQLTGLLQALIEGRGYLRKARASLRQTAALLQKGYGKLVEPEEYGGDVREAIEKLKEALARLDEAQEALTADDGSLTNYVAGGAIVRANMSAREALELLEEVKEETCKKP